MVKIDNNIFYSIGTGFYKEKSSRFISYSFSVMVFNDIKNYLGQLKEKYPDSNHICYAYRLLSGKIINEFATDAGEPKGSSGIPILNNLKRKKLINSAVFVVRYFGGKKLGIQGLIHAYSASTLDCLENSKIGPWIKNNIYILEIKYELLGIVEKIIDNNNGKIIDKNFSEKIQITVELIDKNSELFLNSFSDLKSVKIIDKN